MASKKFSTRITITWHPVTNDGQIRLDLYDFILDDQGNPTGFMDPDSRTINHESIAVASQRTLTPVFSVDPVTGEDVPNLSGASIMGFFKQYVDLVESELANTDPTIPDDSSQNP